MSAKENKITKIRFEYENGLIKEIDGEVLKQWLEDINAVSMSAYLHGVKFRSFNWTIVQEGKDENTIVHQKTEF